MIKIIEFEIGAPDQDGDMSKDLTVEVTNMTEDKIHQLRCETIIFAHYGGPMSFDKETLEHTVEVGEAATFSPWGHIKERATEGSRKDVKVRSNVRLMKQDIIDLGKFEVPLPGGKNFQQLSIDSANLGADAFVDIVVNAPDEDNCCTIEARILIQNDSNTFYDNARALVSILDKKGSEIDYNYCDDDIPVSSNGMFEVHLYIKKSKLKDARLSAKLELYTEAAVESAEKMSDPKDD